MFFYYGPSSKIEKKHLFILRVWFGVRGKLRNAFIHNSLIRFQKEIQSILKYIFWLVYINVFNLIFGENFEIKVWAIF